MSKKGVSTKIQHVQGPLLKYISQGIPIKHACAAVGVPTVTFYDWMKRGEENKSAQFVDFHREVEKAKAVAVMRNVAFIQAAAPETWQAAAWLLERTHPEEFGRDRQNVTVAVQNNTQVVVSENIKERIKKYESLFEDLES